jgi:hypothetical protein
MLGMTRDLRLLPPVSPGLGVYIRAGRNGHSVLSSYVGEGGQLSGIVLDAGLLTRQQELRLEANERGIETILDPCTVELALPGGRIRRNAASSPWAGRAQHRPDDLSGSAGRAVASLIAQFASAHSFAAVIAPTHYISGPADPWFTIDLNLAHGLREELDELGLGTTPIYYRLAIPGTALRDQAKTRVLTAALSKVEIDALWLAVHPFGTSNSGPLSLTGYLRGSRDLHSLGIPLVAERTGTIGVALAAFGAVGGVESGITLGEQFDVKPLLREPSTGPTFAQPPRVYVPSLGTFLSRADASEFFKHRSMKVAFACKDQTCCPNGYVNMLADPRRHFLMQRSREISRLAAAPVELRASFYMDEILRPATDLAIRAVQVLPSLETTRHRLEGWRHALGAQLRTSAITSYSPPAVGGRFLRGAQIFKPRSV